VSRLDRNLIRLRAQKHFLERAAELVAQVPGPVLEIGLGSGRTYDHLRHCLPNRPIYVFDTEPPGASAVAPAAKHFVLGDIQDTLPGARDWLPGPAALIHSDVGSHDQRANLRLNEFIAGWLPELMSPRGIFVCNTPIPRLQRLEDGPGDLKDAYHMYSYVQADWPYRFQPAHP
jgi:hypothetical protein